MSQQKYRVTLEVYSRKERSQTMIFNVAAKSDSEARRKAIEEAHAAELTVRTQLTCRIVAGATSFRNQSREA